MVDNYRPTKFLNILWKLLTEIFAEKTCEHFLPSKIRPDGQNEFHKTHRRRKYHLAVDQIVLQTWKRRQHGIEKLQKTVWYGFFWILECLIMFDVSNSTSNFVIKHARLTCMSIKSGVRLYQEVSFLWWCRFIITLCNDADNTIK